MEEKRKNYLLFTIYDGKGKRDIVYREVHEGIDQVFNQPTDSRGKKLLDTVKRLYQNDPNIRLNFQIRNWI